MAKVQHLEKAPIKEAVIDIQMMETNVDVETLSFELEGFNQVSKITTMQLELALGPGTTQQATNEMHIGYRYVSEDDKYVAQVTKLGFALSRLPPYENWEIFLDKARSVWNRYTDVVGSSSVRRLAVRYINSLNISFADEEIVFKKYLENAPTIRFSDRTSHFLMRFVTILKEQPKMVAVTNETIGDPKDERLPLILDIDVFAEGEEDQALQDMWGILEQLRDYKNEIFFSTMTEKSLELCK